MKRWHEEYARTYTQWRHHYVRHVEQNVEQFTGWDFVVYNDPWEIDCPCDEQKGRFRKMKGRGCPILHCTCQKRYDGKSKAELIAKLNFKEEMEELW